MKGIAVSLPALVSILLVAGCASSENQRRGEGLAVNAMTCGQADIGLDYHEDHSGLTITFGSDKMVLKQKESASGARFVDPDNDDTQFWNKGDTATLTFQHLITFVSITLARSCIIFQHYKHVSARATILIFEHV